MKSLHLLLLIAILLIAQHGRSHGFLHGSKMLGIGVSNQQTRAIRIAYETKASRGALAVIPFVFLQRLGARKLGDDNDGEQLSESQGDSAASDIPNEIGKKSKKPKKQRKRAPKVTEQDISNSADGDNLLEEEEVETFVLAEETIDQIGDNRQRLEAFLNQVIKAIENAKAIGNIDEKDELVELKGSARFVLKRLGPGDPSASLRVANVDFEISRQALLQDFDFNLFRARVLDLFQWYSRPTVMATYLAPYFPMVQSSGMGKTKLLWELRKLVDEKSDESFARCVCKTILCAVMGSEIKIQDEKVYSSIFEVTTTQGVNERNRICETLDSIRTQNNNYSTVILLFDESQHLLKNDGYAFRCVRWWLRRKRPEGPKVVAVFTGTTSQLTNFYAEPPITSTSRQPNITLYRTSGTSLYEPFWNLCTIGLFANKPGEGQNLASSMATPLSDYERAIPYGRPLFAVMHKKGKFDDNAEFSVLSRMLLSKQDGWSDNDRVCVSVLGTRLQIGQTSVNLASDLVAKGYALLSNYVPKSGGSDGSACIFFPPDPVCARLAMRLMDEDTVISYEGIKFGGLDKTFWMSKLTKIFSTGLCIPNQGDLGEVAAASYLLFCGDLIRKTIDKNYTTFSVPLSTYVQCLLSPHEFIQPRQPDESDQQMIVTESDQQMIVTEGSMFRDAHVSFIQVTRNYIRFDASYFHNQGFLRELYESGNALYTYPGFDTFDLVASIKLTSFKNKETYAPFFISVSTTTVEESENTDLSAIKTLLANTSNPQKGLGIQLRFDRSKKGFQPSPNILTVEDVRSLLNGEAIAKVVFVPKDDPFGVTSMLTETILCGSAKSEIYASHSNLYNHPLSEVDSAKLLRSNSRQETSSYMDTMRLALLKSRQMND